MERRYGFIHERLDIKILILFILRRMPEPISFDALTELTMCDGAISYFDFAECVGELVKSGHILIKDEKYYLTSKGVRNSEMTEQSLPYSVRIDAENATFEYRSRQTRNSLIKTSHEINQDGSYKVALALSDGVGEIISMDLLAMSEQQAKTLERGFRKNAEAIYNKLIGMILGQK